MRVEYTHMEQNLSNTNKTEDVVTKRLSSSLKFFFRKLDNSQKIMLDTENGQVFDFPQISFFTTNQKIF